MFLLRKKQVGQETTRPLPSICSQMTIWFATHLSNRQGLRHVQPHHQATVLQNLFDETTREQLQVKSNAKIFCASCFSDPCGHEHLQDLFYWKFRFSVCFWIGYIYIYIYIRIVVGRNASSCLGTGCLLDQGSRFVRDGGMEKVGAACRKKFCEASKVRCF